MRAMRSTTACHTEFRKHSAAGCTLKNRQSDRREMGLFFDRGNSTATALPFLNAWAAAHHEWNWQGRTRLDQNLRAFESRYDVDWQNSAVPPWRLVAEWRDDGCPEPSAWIDARLAVLLREDQPRDLAV